MKNSFYNLFIFEINDNDFSHIIGSISNDGKIDFNTIIPLPNELKNRAFSSKNIYLIEKYGADNWFDWSLQKWGTKYNAENSFIGKKKHTIFFNTSCGTPTGLINKLITDIPSISFTFIWQDIRHKTNYGALTIKNGIIKKNEKVLDSHRNIARKPLNLLMGSFQKKLLTPFLK